MEVAVEVSVDVSVDVFVEVFVPGAYAPDDLLLEQPPPVMMGRNVKQARIMRISRNLLNEPAFGFERAILINSESIDLALITIII